MSGTRSATGTGSTVPQQSTRPGEFTTWAGWTVFAASMLGLVGFFHVIQGLVAIFEDDFYLVTKRGLTVNVDFTTWGWTHILAGAIVLLAAFGLVRGQMWARVVGVIFAVVSALLNFAFIAAYPFWSVIVIALDVFVIMALTVHGRDIQKAL